MGTARLFTEIAPPPRLADSVECFWISHDSQPNAVHRVVPDTCADIIYTRAGARSELSFVGVMTAFKDFSIPAGAHLVGVRFRPGMWSDLIGGEVQLCRDQLIELEDLWGRRAAQLHRILDGTDRASDMVKALEHALPCVAGRSPVQKAIGAIESSHGSFALDRASKAAGLSSRQFRRSCLEVAGLSPKQLARISRFRLAMKLARVMIHRHADLAAECGYADQSHFIAEFREFAGRTPARCP